MYSVRVERSVPGQAKLHLYRDNVKVGEGDGYINMPRVGEDPALHTVSPTSLRMLIPDERDRFQEQGMGLKHRNGLAFLAALANEGIREHGIEESPMQELANSAPYSVRVTRKSPGAAQIRLYHGSVLIGEGSGTILRTGGFGRTPTAQDYAEGFPVVNNGLKVFQHRERMPAIECAVNSAGAMSTAAWLNGLIAGALSREGILQEPVDGRLDAPDLSRSHGRGKRKVQTNPSWKPRPLETVGEDGEKKRYYWVRNELKEGVEGELGKCTICVYRTPDSRPGEIDQATVLVGMGEGTLVTEGSEQRMKVTLGDFTYASEKEIELFRMNSIFVGMGAISLLSRMVEEAQCPEITMGIEAQRVEADQVGNTLADALRSAMTGAPMRGTAVAHVAENWEDQAQGVAP
jgi:hypothetical protein